jgi:hypothetical protein
MLQHEIAQYIKNAAAQNHKGLMAYDVYNYYVHQGKAFAVTKRFTVSASGGVLDIVLDPTSCSCDNLEFLPSVYKATAGPVYVDFYAGTNADADGTVLSSLNRNLTSSNTSDVIFRANPTINNTGTKGAEFLVPSDGNAAVASAGGESKEDTITVFGTSVKYMVRIINNDATNDAIVHVTFNWIEKT